MAEPHAPTDLATVFPGETAMARRCRAFDWAATSLGPVAAWSPALRTAAALVVAAGFPAILLWGPDLIQVYNDGYVPFLGAKHPAGLGMATHECWPEVRGTTAPIYARVLAGETVAFRDRPYPLQRRGPDRPPEDVYITLAYSPVPDGAGAVGGVFVTLLETTADVQARALEAERARLVAELGAERARLRAVLLQLPVPVALFEGPALRHALVNAAYRRISGGGRDVTGLTPAEAYPELAGSGFFELIAGVYATGAPWVGPETPVRYDRDGAGPMDTWWDLRYVPVRDAAGAVAGVLSVAVDLTAQVLARREVERLLGESEALRAEAEEARSAAEAASRAKGEFLATMSHELRTPLNAIGGYAQLLDMGLHGPVTEAQRGALARVQGAQARLLALINDVLNYAKLESGRVDYDVRPVDVADVVRDVAPLVEPQLRAKGLAFDVRLPETSCVVAADREKLGQVLVNLLSNAVKFTDSPHPGTGAPGRVTVEVATRARGGARAVAGGATPEGATPEGATPGGAADGWAFLRVRDTGRGIAREKQDAIFEPFVQVRAGAGSAYAQATEGTGLGLAISRDLARGMGGDLRVRSAPGEGATFTVALRRVMADADAGAAPAGGAPSSD